MSISCIINSGDKLMNDYINIFIDKEYPTFLDKYIKSKTWIRIKNVPQF